MCSKADHAFGSFSARRYEAATLRGLECKTLQQRSGARPAVTGPTFLQRYVLRRQAGHPFVETGHAILQVAVGTAISWVAKLLFGAPYSTIPVCIILALRSARAAQIVSLQTYAIIKSFCKAHSLILYMTARSSKSAYETDAFKRGMVRFRATDDPVVLAYTGLAPSGAASESSA